MQHGAGRAGGNDGEEKARQQTMRRLYWREVGAFVCCSVLPAGGAWILDTARVFLNLPSQSAVSKISVALFAIVAELRVVAHLAKLVQAHTLTPKRAEAPTAATREPVESHNKSNSSIELDDTDDTDSNHNKNTDIDGRIGRLEARVESILRVAQDPGIRQAAAAATANTRKLVACIVAEIIDPQLRELQDELARSAVRTSTLASLTDARLHAIDQRLSQTGALADETHRWTRDLVNRNPTWKQETQRRRPGILAAIYNALVGLLTGWYYGSYAYVYEPEWPRARPSVLGDLEQEPPRLPTATQKVRTLVPAKGARCRGGLAPVIEEDGEDDEEEDERRRTLGIPLSEAVTHRSKHMSIF